MAIYITVYDRAESPPFLATTAQGLQFHHRLRSWPVLARHASLQKDLLEGHFLRALLGVGHVRLVSQGVALREN